MSDPKNLNERVSAAKAARPRRAARPSTPVPAASIWPPFHRKSAGTTGSSSTRSRGPSGWRSATCSCPTTCFNCESACGLLAYIDKDTMQVRKFEGNPEHPGSRGRNCAKGPATLNQITDPDRILYPLKRAGARGEGKWERISWDEALDTLAGAHPQGDPGEAAQGDHVPRRPPRRGRLHRAHARRLGGRRSQLAHQHLLGCRPGRIPVLVRHRPSEPRPRAGQGDLPHQLASRDRPLLQPARAADHGGQGERGEAHRPRHQAVQHRYPRRLLAGHDSRAPKPRSTWRSPIT